MPEIEVDEATYQVLRITARLTNRTEGEVIAKMVRDWGAKPTMTPASNVKTAPNGAANEVIGIYAEYHGTRVDAVLDRMRETVKITSAPLAGEAFTSPSAAAIGVVERLNPERRYTNTNGWRFWRLTENDHLIDSIRRGRQG